MLAAGEFPLGLTYFHQVVSLKKKGAPVDWVRTMQTIVTGLKPISLSAKALHPNAGKLFVDLFSRKKAKNSFGVSIDSPAKRREFGAQGRRKILSRRSALGR